jgi:hypothetical protein
MLEQHGYVKGRGGRYIRPGGRSESVSVEDGKSCHFSTNDPLNDGKVRSGIGVHDSFDVYCHFVHGGDIAKAVRAASEEMGIGSLASPTIYGDRIVMQPLRWRRKAGL